MDRSGNLQMYYRSLVTCGAEADLSLRLRPLQSGFRIATLDGGGIFGINELIAWQTLLEGLPLGLQPYHFLDFIVGESAGM
ncbi:hypothetical protein N7512_007574 [Penicillium capsulatum]|nr:hypothetical protein N7512_007574 [Penicillium capsulatum]